MGRLMDDLIGGLQIQIVKHDITSWQVSAPMLNQDRKFIKSNLINHVGNTNHLSHQKHSS
jgi:hypothetical protein